MLQLIYAPLPSIEWKPFRKAWVRSSHHVTICGKADGLFKVQVNVSRWLCKKLEKRNYDDLNKMCFVCLDYKKIFKNLIIVAFAIFLRPNHI